MLAKTADVISTRLYFNELNREPVPNPEDDFPLFFAFEEARTNLWELLFSFPFFLSRAVSPLENVIRLAVKPYHVFRHEGQVFTPPPMEALLEAATDFRQHETQLRRMHQAEALLHTPMRNPIHDLARRITRLFLSLDVNMRLQNHLRDRGIECVLEARTKALTSPRSFDSDLGVCVNFLQESLKELRRNRDQMHRLRSKIVERHLRLVVSIVNQNLSKANHMDGMDLIAEGNTGLLEAIDRFDPHRGIRFGTYAVWWIRQAVSAAIKNQSRTIRIPFHQFEKAQRVSRAVAELTAEGVELPIPIGLIAARSGLEVENVTTALGLPLALNLLDRPLAFGEHGTISDTFADHKTPWPDADARDHLLQEQIRSAIEMLLTAREREIVLRYYGFQGDEPETLRQIRVHIPLTEERIRQIKAKALRKLQKATRGFRESV